MTKEELQEDYKLYVQKVAHDILNNKPTNEQILKKIHEIQSQILNKDIMEQVKLQSLQRDKKSEATPIDPTQSYKTATVEGFRELVQEYEEENLTNIPKSK